MVVWWLLVASSVRIGAGFPAKLRERVGVCLALGVGGRSRVRVAVRERVQLAQAKRSGSRRRSTRLIPCAGYAREQARSLPPDRVFVSAQQRVCNHLARDHRPACGGVGCAPWSGHVRLAVYRAGCGFAAADAMRARACPVSLCDRAPLGAGAEDRPRKPPQLARPLPNSAAASLGCEIIGT
jgi:hypothetical protein